MNKNTCKIYKLEDFTEIIRINKETNFSKVYIATLKETGEQLILKYFIHSSNIDISEYISKEIFINKYLSDNTNISVGFKGICLDEYNRYIFLVLNRGEFSLYNYFCETDYSPRDIKKIFYEAIKILFILHSHGIVHNDIKLENFIFENTKLKIIDFGLSDFLYYSPPVDTIKRYVCTEYTKAPDSRKSFETDIYSLGITMIHLTVKDYFKPEIKYDEDDIKIVKFIKNDNSIIGTEEYNKEYFINKMGKEFYDLIKTMISKNPLKRLDILSILNHEYFSNFGKININNFNKNPKKFDNYDYNHIILSNNPMISTNILWLNHNYSKEEYFNNFYEIKYKDLHHDLFKNKKFKLNFLLNEKNFNLNINKCLIDLQYHNYDSIVNAIILLRNSNILDNINTNFTKEHFYMLCILFNSIFSCNASLIEYSEFNKIIKINKKLFSEIYFNCLKLLINNYNLYFINSLFSYYIDKLVHEYKIINSNYLLNLKSKCFDLFYFIITQIKTDEEIEVNKIIIFIINNFVSDILKRNKLNYNLNPIIEEMKLTEIEFGKFNDLINLV